MRETEPAERLCWPLSWWPLGDQKAWAAALLPSELFESSSPAADWSPATLRKRAAGYGRYLSWLAERGQLDPLASISARVSRALLAAYVIDLKKTNKGHTIQNRIQELGDALRALDPETDWRWISRGAGRLRATTIPARDKRSRLRPIEVLVQEGLELVELAEQKPGLSARARAVLFRDALMVLFFCFHPIRLRNFAGLRLGDHITVHGNNLLLALSAKDTKGRRQPYEAVVPALLLVPLQRYLQVHRLILLAARPPASPPTDALWVSAQGTALKDSPISVRVAKATARSGPPIRPHLFRSCAGTTIATQSPHDVYIVAPVLGHPNPEISERYYIMAGSLEASRAYGAIIEELRCKPNAASPTSEES